MNNQKLNEKKCIPCEGGATALTQEQANRFLAQLNNWTLTPDASEIFKKFVFKNYYQTMAFVNAVAWIANQENHHPDLEVSYNTCIVRYTTHAIAGLSENDFICASKVDALKAVTVG